MAYRIQELFIFCPTIIIFKEHSISVSKSKYSCHRFRNKHLSYSDLYSPNDINKNDHKNIQNVTINLSLSKGLVLSQSSLSLSGPIRKVRSVPACLCSSQNCLCTVDIRLSGSAFQFSPSLLARFRLSLWLIFVMGKCICTSLTTHHLLMSRKGLCSEGYA